MINRSLIILRVQSPSELLAVQRFRYGIYVEELAKRLPAADHQARILRDEDDTDAEHFYCVTDNGEMVGSVRLHITPFIPTHVLSSCRLQSFMHDYSKRVGYISKLMLARGARGHSGAMKLLSHVYCHGRDRQAVVCINSCNPKLVNFYEHMGLHKFARPFQDASVGLQVPMVQILEDAAHYKLQDSFLLHDCQKYANDPESVAYLRQWFLHELAFKDTAIVDDTHPYGSSDVLLSAS